MVAGGLYTPEKKTLPEAGEAGFGRLCGHSRALTCAAMRASRTSCGSWWWGSPAQPSPCPHAALPVGSTPQQRLQAFTDAQGRGFIARYAHPLCRQSGDGWKDGKPCGKVPGLTRKFMGGPRPGCPHRAGDALHGELRGRLRPWHGGREAHVPARLCPQDHARPRGRHRQGRTLSHTQASLAAACGRRRIAHERRYRRGYVVYAKRTKRIRRRRERRHCGQQVTTYKPKL